MYYKLKLITVCCCLIGSLYAVSILADTSNSEPGNRHGSFINKTDFNMKIWVKLCAKYKNGVLKCESHENEFSLAPHTPIPPHFMEKFPPVVEAWPYITHAQIMDGSYKGLITTYTVDECSDIHAWGINGRLELDLNNNLQKITCQNILE